uniref:Uncharacterized protein n=1 Tax=Rhizophora mucronata TaxID=61149 RepID=A0A2P2N7W2_RHIMU
MHWILTIDVDLPFYNSCLNKFEHQAVGFPCVTFWMHKFSLLMFPSFPELSLCFSLNKCF